MIETALICLTTSGKTANSKATFVSVPVATTQHDPGGVFIIALYIAKMAFPGWTATPGGGLGRRSVPSIPESPWISGAWTAGRMYGLEEPEKTGMSVRPMAVRMERALAVTLGIEALPWTVEICHSGDGRLLFSYGAVVAVMEGRCVPLIDSRRGVLRRV